MRRILDYMFLFPDINVQNITYYNTIPTYFNCTPGCGVLQLNLTRLCNIIAHDHHNFASLKQ